MTADPTATLRLRHARERHDLERFQAQADFVRRLTELHPTEAATWLRLVDEATQAMAGQGLAAAERILAPVAPIAKSYTVHCVGHAHIDMNWLWGWPETVAITLDTFRTVLGLMDEFPTFTFSQSQASVYRIVKEHDPALLARIKQRIREGRWEVTASHWVEGDRNIAGAEPLVRQLVETRRFMQEEFGLTPEDVPIDWSPDTFGHAATIPAIDARAGVRYMYCCRTGTTDRPPVFWWQAADGSRLLVNRETGWYNSEAAPDRIGLLVDFCKRTGLKDWMQVYGVGDHGGGPTRRDLRRFQDMDSWPVFPRWRFARATDFFAILEREGARWPTLAHELNFEFTGCYTSQSMIKRGNRSGERLMTRAEAALALAGGRAADLSNGWRDVLFGHFHDILPGSGVPQTRFWQLGLLQRTEAEVGERVRSALRGLAGRIRTDLVPTPSAADLPSELSSRAYGAGVGRGIVHHGGDGPRAFVVFNPVGTARQEVVQLTVWDGDGGPEAPRPHQRRWRAVFADGTRLPVQGCGDGHYWGHDYADLLVPLRIGSLGWSTVVLEEGEAPEPADRVRIIQNQDGGHGQRQNLPAGLIGIANGQVEVGIDRATGCIRSLRVQGVEFAAGGLATIEHQQERPMGMSAWCLGDPAGQPMPLQVLGLRISEWGPWRASVEVQLAFNDSRVTVTYSLVAGSPVVQVGVKTRWLERGTPETGIPRLQMAMPCALADASGRYEVPFGAVARPAQAGRTVPALRWAAVVGNQDGRPAGLQLINDGAHGHELDGSTLRVNLLRSSYEPDPLPEIGDHAWRFGIQAWIGERSEAELVRTAMLFDQPAEPIATNLHAGSLPAVAEVLSSDHPDLVVTALKPADDGRGLVLRLANHGDAAVPARIVVGSGFPITGPVTSACDVLERGQTDPAEVPAHGLTTLRLRPHS